MLPSEGESVRVYWIQFKKPGGWVNGAIYKIALIDATGVIFEGYNLFHPMDSIRCFEKI